MENQSYEKKMKDKVPTSVCKSDKKIFFFFLGASMGPVVNLDLRALEMGKKHG